MLATNSNNPTVNERNQAMNWLMQTFPSTFDVCDRRPLKIDILDDILMSSKKDIPTKQALTDALYFYTQWGSYLNALVPGSKRIDLNGNVCDTVTQEQAASAQQPLNQASNHPKP